LRLGLGRVCWPCGAFLRGLSFVCGGYGEQTVTRASSRGGPRRLSSRPARLGPRGPACLRRRSGFGSAGLPSSGGRLHTNDQSGLRNDHERTVRVGALVGVPGETCPSGRFRRAPPPAPPVKPSRPGRTPFGRVRAPNPYLPKARRPPGSNRAGRQKRPRGRPRLDARADGVLAVTAVRALAPDRAAEPTASRPRSSSPR
jgi:hypothetical protein